MRNHFRTEALIMLAYFVLPILVGIYIRGCAENFFNEQSAGTEALTHYLGRILQFVGIVVALSWAVVLLITGLTQTFFNRSKGDSPFHATVFRDAKKLRWILYLAIELFLIGTLLWVLSRS